MIDDLLSAWRRALVELEAACVIAHLAWDESGRADLELKRELLAAQQLRGHLELYISEMVFRQPIADAN